MADIITIAFEMDEISGKCLTPCPNGVDCMVYSLKCKWCGHFLGLVDGENIIKCTGVRSEKQKKKVKKLSAKK